MERRHWIMFMLVASSYLLQVTARPSETESLAPQPDNETYFGEASISQQRGIQFYTNTKDSENVSEDTSEILNRIQSVNNKLRKPLRQPAYHNINEGKDSLVLDEDTIAKLQQLILNGKLQELSSARDSNTDYEKNNIRNAFSRALSLPSFHQGISSAQIDPINAIPFTIANLPVLMPLKENFLQNYGNFATSRQRPPQLPFQLQWPLAPLFPILIKDPLVTYLHGGGWSNLFEYGQNADVCNRKLKSNDDEPDSLNEIESNLISQRSLRKSRSIKKRNIKHATPVQLVEPKKSKSALSFLTTKHKITKKKPVKSVPAANNEEEYEDTKGSASDSGDLRHPFSDFGLFGNRKPVAPSPGFFINRLKVRRGGVAIAGPGGVATAGRGGTAIVGPGGLAYTQPGGMAVAGPAAKIYALSSETDLNHFITKLHDHATNEDEWVSVMKFAIGTYSFKVSKNHVVPILRDNPNSHELKKNISVQYLPFYGGAKGQYLEVTIDSSGNTIRERIVPEDSVSSENIVKYSDENLLSKVLRANLQTLQTQSTNLLKLHSLAQKNGPMGKADKAKFKEQLVSIGESSSNLVKLIEEIGEDVNVLFRVAPARKNEYDDENVGEEGVGVDSNEEGEDKRFLLAEAKPVGLAVVGESGSAASRPIATAVAISGAAVARPIATAIAGVDPAALGITFQIHQTNGKTQ